jgi:hypothetical protein
MKNTQKALVLLLVCALIGAFIFSCVSTGGGGASGGGEVVRGTWEFSPNNDANDGGTSTINMVVAEEVIDGETVTTHAFSGVVGTTARQYGGVIDVTMTPDEATLEAIKKLSPTGALSFKLLGDGRTYIIEAPISTVTDWGFHRFAVKTEPDVVQEHKIQMRMFIQPSWASEVRFNRERITSFRIATQSATDGGEGPYSFKIWDLAIHP